MQTEMPVKPHLGLLCGSCAKSGFMLKRHIGLGLWLCGHCYVLYGLQEGVRERKSTLIQAEPNMKRITEICNECTKSANKKSRGPFTVMSICSKCIKSIWTPKRNMWKLVTDKKLIKNSKKIEKRKEITDDPNIQKKKRKLHTNSIQGEHVPKAFKRNKKSKVVEIAKVLEKELERKLNEEESYSSSAIKEKQIIKLQEEENWKSNKKIRKDPPIFHTTGAFLTRRTASLFSDNDIFEKPSRNQFVMNKEIEVLGLEGIYWPAKMIAYRSGQILCSFDGWNSSFNEWIDSDSVRIREKVNTGSTAIILEKDCLLLTNHQQKRPRKLRKTKKHDSTKKINIEPVDPEIEKYVIISQYLYICFLFFVILTYSSQKRF